MGPWSAAMPKSPRLERTCEGGVGGLVCFLRATRLGSKTTIQDNKQATVSPKLVQVVLFQENTNRFGTCHGIGSLAALVLPHVCPTAAFTLTWSTTHFCSTTDLFVSICGIILHRHRQNPIHCPSQCCSFVTVV